MVYCRLNYPQSHVPSRTRACSRFVRQLSKRVQDALAKANEVGMQRTAAKPPQPTNSTQTRLYVP